MRNKTGSPRILSRRNALSQSISLPFLPLDKDNEGSENEIVRNTRVAWRIGLAFAQSLHLFVYGFDLEFFFTSNILWNLT